jgi:hypothetical protein
MKKSTEENKWCITDFKARKAGENEFVVVPTKSAEQNGWIIYYRDLTWTIAESRCAKMNAPKVKSQGYPRTGMDYFN